MALNQSFLICKIGITSAALYDIFSFKVVSFPQVSPIIFVDAAHSYSFLFRLVCERIPMLISKSGMNLLNFDRNLIVV